MWKVLCVSLTALSIAACGERPALMRVIDARHRVATMVVQFTRASDATNRAVMADTDEASVAFAGEAERAREAVQREVDALGPMLESLQFADESRLLQDFVRHFAAYRDLDQAILALAVENTNLKAQRLSFGPASAAADALRDALDGLRARGPDEWPVTAWKATALANVREIQALQAPHIADPDDTSMTRIEARMKEAESRARAALDTLGRLAPPAGRSRVQAAVTAFEQFLVLHRQITELSRRNTNVRSLGLSLNEKGKRTVPCEQTLQALGDALGARMSAGAR